MLSQTRPTSLLAVSKSPEPVDPPPPPGSVWAAIERERIALGWSQRKLAREAGLKSESHYGLIGTQSNWNAEDKTREAIVAALTRAGVDRNVLIPDVTAVLDMLAPLRKHAAALLQLPPYDYPVQLSHELVSKVLAFKHDTQLDAAELAALADHVHRVVEGLPPREAPRSSTGSIPPKVEAAFLRQADQLGEKRANVSRRNAGKKR